MTTVHHRKSGRSFFLTPLLEKGGLGWGLDPYERFLIAQIKNQRHCRALFDTNSLFVGSGEGADHQVYAAKTRYKLTPEQLEEYRQEIAKERLARFQNEAQAAAHREASIAGRKAAQEERARWTIEYERINKARVEDAHRRNREWEDAERARKTAWHRMEEEAMQDYQFCLAQTKPNRPKPTVGDIIEMRYLKDWHSSKVLEAYAQNYAFIAMRISDQLVFNLLKVDSPGWRWPEEPRRSS